MTGKTHRIGGILCCFAGYTILNDKGLLVSNINPLLQVTVMYPFALFGSTLPDLDHHEDSIPSRDIISVIINKVLHLSTKARKMKEKITKNADMGVLGVFDAKHRSWQTHSDLFLILFLMLFSYLISAPVQTPEIAILRMITSGLVLGVVSHYILDLLTPEGIWSLLILSLKKIFKGNKIIKNLPKKVQLVPDSEFFATDGPWEGLIRGLLWVLNIIYLVIIIYPLLPYKLEFSFG